MGAKPIAIDLFCGLVSGQPELFLGADATVQKLMACRAENPNHVGTGVLHLAECSVSAVLWTMGKLNDSAFATGLARSWQIRVFSAHPDNHARVLELSATVIDLLDRWVLSVKRSTLLFGCLARTVLRAISAVAVWLDDFKMLSANPAVPSVTGDIGLLAPPQPTSTRLTFERTVALVGALRLKFDAARRAE
jgi:hypothetical protein